MPRFAPLLPILFAGLATAQTIPTLKADTKIVVIDVVVTDKSGHPVHNLKSSDFSLAENGVHQTIAHFDAHSSFTVEQAATVEAMPRLAPNIFTNYSPVPLDSTLNVILLDAMNTRQKTSSVVIQQALKFLSTLHPGAQIEIFELEPEGNLKLIQGFTSDPEILRAAISNRKVKPQYSGVDNELRRCGIVDYSVDMDGASGLEGGDAGSSSSGAATCLATNLKVRSVSTLQALAALAKYMGNLSGRKNLLWFSSSFTMPPTQRDVLDELHRTMALFAKRQVVVYPIVANGLTSPAAVPSYLAGAFTVGGSVSMANPRADLNRTDSEKATMEVMAEDTGGKVYANTNDFAGAAARGGRRRLQLLHPHLHSPQ